MCPVVYESVCNISYCKSGNFPVILFKITLALNDFLVEFFFMKQKKTSQNLIITNDNYIVHQTPEDDCEQKEHLLTSSVPCPNTSRRACVLK